MGHDATRLCWLGLSVPAVTAQNVTCLNQEPQQQARETAARRSFFSGIHGRSTVSISSLANGALDEHRRHDSKGISPEIAPPGCRVRRSAEPHCPHAGQENVNHGSPAANRGADRRVEPQRAAAGLPRGSRWRRSSRPPRSPCARPRRVWHFRRPGRCRARVLALGGWRPIVEGSSEHDDMASVGSSYAA